MADRNPISLSEFPHILLKLVVGSEAAKAVIEFSINSFAQKYENFSVLPPVKLAIVSSDHIKLTNRPQLYSTLVEHVSNFATIEDWSHPSSVEPIDIASDFFMKALRGQKGLIAARDLEPYDVLGIFWGEITTMLEFEKVNDPDDLSNEKNQNAFLLEVGDQMPLYIDPTSGKGSVFRYLNDCREYIHEDDILKEDEERLNVEFVHGTVVGFPLIFMVVCDSVKSGNMLWGYYGPHYIC